MNSLKNANFFLHESLLEEQIFLCSFGSSVRLWLGILGISLTKVEGIIEFSTMSRGLSEQSCSS